MDISWLGMLLFDLGLSSTALPTLFCDNVSAITLTTNPICHARTKHIEVDIHFVPEKVQHQEIKIHFIPSELQVADLLTKPLSAARFHDFAFKLLGFFKGGMISYVM